jgi:hypothetical protein
MLAGPMLLLLYQIAPVGAEPDSAGRLRLTLGYGTGQLEHRKLNCAGDVVSSSPVDFRSLGVRVDAWPGDMWRLTGFGGVEGPGFGDLFGGAQAAVEGRHAGFGLGVTQSRYAVAESGTTIYPSVYLRLGDLDRPHVRLDLWDPSPTFGTTGVVRLGIGVNQGHLRGASGFLGVSIGPYSDQSHVGGFFGELYFPVAGSLDVMTAGSFRPSQQYGDWGLALGARLHLGR